MKLQLLLYKVKLQTDHQKNDKTVLRIFLLPIGTYIEISGEIIYLSIDPSNYHISTCAHIYNVHTSAWTVHLESTWI